MLAELETVSAAMRIGRPGRPHGTQPLDDMEQRIESGEWIVTVTLQRRVTDEVRQERPGWFRRVH